MNTLVTADLECFQLHHLPLLPLPPGRAELAVLSPMLAPMLAAAEHAEGRAAVPGQGPAGARGGHPGHGQSGLQPAPPVAHGLLLAHGLTSPSVLQSTPRGVQLYLGRGQQERVVDTLVMANLGYFQLKASPGVWTLQLAPGPSQDLYAVQSVADARSSHSAQVSSYCSRQARLVA